jgi:long-chain fatty acid transport protein
MKKTLFSLASLLLPLFVMAGGIVTNVNQSAMFTRMQARDATIGIDAVYFNPAGLTLLPNDGLFISLNNQTVGQTRTIKTNYPYLNQKEYEGKVFAPFFPGIYAAYKTGKFAFSLGFNPIGGGGGGIYDKGLPSFEYDVSDLVPALQSKGLPINGYSANVKFEGHVAYFGYQANISYKINDMISVGIGGRFVMAKESYNGHLKDVMIDSAGKWMRADDFFTSSATKASAGATMASGAATQMQPIIDGGGGILTFEQAEAMSIITATQRAQMEGGLNALGIDPTGMTIAQAQAAYQGAASTLTSTAQQSTAKATILHDQEVEYEKTARGFTPIISVNIKPMENMNIALKYEGNTKLEFENNTTKDFLYSFDNDGQPLTMFPDGKKTRYDIPAQLAAGITYRPVDKLFISAGFHYYFDQQANWEGKEDSLKGNLTEYALGIEYTLSKKLVASVGWLKTHTGAQGGFQTDLSFSMNSNTFGGGFGIMVTPYLELNLAGAYTLYETGSKTFNHDLARSGTFIPVKEEYDKDVWIVSIGLNFNLAALKNKE